MAEADIQALRAKWPLPEGQADAEVNRTMLAIAMDVSEPTLTKWLGQGMPCLQEGGNGREYSFSLADCYAWRMERDSQIKADRAAASDAAAQMSSLFRNLGEDAPTAGMTAKQIQEEAEAELRWQRASEGRRELVRASQVRVLYEETLIHLRNTITAMSDFAEAEFGLSPEQVAKVDARGDVVLEIARRDLEALLRRPADVVAMQPGAML